MEHNSYKDKMARLEREREEVIKQLTPETHQEFKKKVEHLANQMDGILPNNSETGPKKRKE